MNTYCVNQFNICIMKSINLLTFKNSYTQDEVNKGGIYLIKCNANDCVYVGQARWFIKRWLEHQGCLYKKKYGSSYLQNSYNKYGNDSFEFIIHEYLPEELQVLAYKYKATDIEYLPVAKWLNEKETYYIEKFRNELGERKVFNYTTGGDHPIPNKECRKRHSVAMKKVWKDESYRKTMNESAFQNKEWLKLQSEIHKAQWKDPNYRKRNCENRRKTMSTEEYRKRRSEISTNMWTDELRKKHSNTLKISMNKPHIRERLKKVNKEKMKDPNLRNHLSNKAKEQWERPGFREYFSQQKRKKYLEKVQECDKHLALLYEDEPDVKKWSLRRKKDLINAIAEELRKHPIS